MDNLINRTLAWEEEKKMFLYDGVSSSFAAYVSVNLFCTHTGTGTGTGTDTYTHSDDHVHLELFLNKLVCKHDV